MANIYYNDNFPSVEFQNKKYWQIGCKKRENSVWKMYSDGIDFVYECANCLNIDKLRITKLQNEPNE